MNHLTKGLVALCMVGLIGCGNNEDNNDGNNGDGNNTTANNTTNNTNGGGTMFDSATKIGAFLDGKELVMEGDNIPTHPNGFSEDVNLGANTQCYNQSADYHSRRHLQRRLATRHIGERADDGRRWRVRPRDGLR